MGRGRTPVERMALRSIPDGKGMLTTPGHTKIPGNVVLPRKPGKPADRNELPELPEHIGELGREAWYNTWDYCWWLQPRLGDATFVLQIAEATDEHERMRQLVEDEGRMIDGGRNNGRKMHPAVAEMRRLRAEIRDCQVKLCMTPGDRTRLQYYTVQTQTGLKDLQDRCREAAAQRDMVQGEVVE
jgi:P27 family predicted phage terminase small subunit